MEKFCSICGRPKPENKSGHILFEHRNIKFNLEASTADCNSCRKAEFVENFEKYAYTSAGDRKLIFETENGFRIDWEYYFTFYNTRYDNGKKAASVLFNNILFAIGVFSFKPDGNWIIIDRNGNILNPGMQSIFGKSLTTYYFGSKEEATAFAKVLPRWSSINNDCRWSVFQLKS